MSSSDEKTQTKGIVLVVDDNPLNLDLLSNILRQNGYEVRAAISGALALQSLRLSLPDLILLDIRMPQMDGYEVCGRLKADRRTRDIPVIFVSAVGDIMDKVRAFDVGGVDYITRPFQSEEVLARVGTHITLRAMQKALIQSERLAALGRISQSVAHEVRNPVTVIGGFALRLQKLMPGDDPMQDIVSVILRQTERLECIVADVGKYCTLRQPVQQPADLGEIVETVLLDHSEGIERQGITVRRNGFQWSREILCDEELLKHALNNIILNAVESMPEGGTLELTMTPEPDGLLLSIKDTGAGIPPDIVQHAFEPFFVPKEHRSGFGLALAHRIIREQAGEIRLCSSPGTGMDIQIKMPLAGS